MNLWIVIGVALFVIVLFNRSSSSVSRDYSNITDEEIRLMLKANRKIEAIKAIRQKKNIGLKEAKEEAERILDEMKGSY